MAAYAVRVLARLLSGSTTFLAVAVLAITCSTLKAQFTSVIEGRVSDPSDAVVPNAEVTIESQATGVKRLVRTNEIGYYRVGSLPPGQITIRVSAPGFDTA